MLYMILYIYNYIVSYKVGYEEWYALFFQNPKVPESSFSINKKPKYPQIKSVIKTSFFDSKILIENYLSTHSFFWIKTSNNKL